MVVGLQLPIQSVPITINVVSSNPANLNGEVYLIQHYVISLSVTYVCGFLQVLRVSSTIKTDRHDITEILLKVALNTITLTQPHLSNLESH